MSWIAIIIAVVAIMLTVLNQLSPYTLSDEDVSRLSVDKIKVYLEIYANRHTPRTGKCEGSLKIGHINVLLPPQSINLLISQCYPVTLEGQYKGELSGNGILKLRLTLGNEKPKTLKKKIWVSIPAEMKN